MNGSIPRRARHALCCASLLLSSSTLIDADRVHAQSTPSTPSTVLRLGEMQAAAVRHDPRAASSELEARAALLRVRRNDTGALPQLRFSVEATRQSDVIELPFTLPGAPNVAPPKDRYDARLGVQWSLWDGGARGARSTLEERALGVTDAEIEASLFDVRAAVDDAFFAALLLQERARETAAMLEDLQARIDETRARVDAGAALPADLSYLQAERLVVQQRADGIEADRRAALDVLAQWTGTTIATDAVVEFPDLAATTEEVLAPLPQGKAADTTTLPEPLRRHPRFAVLDAQRARLEQGITLAHTQRRPQASAFGELSYGSPGQRQFDDDLHDEWRVGVRLDWVPWDWSHRDREVDELRVQERLLDVQEKVFTASLLRALQSPLRTIDHLQDALTTDATIIALRADVERSMRVRFGERAVAASDYIDARTDLLDARIARAQHAAELERARAQVLLTLGMEIEAHGSHDAR